MSRKDPATEAATILIVEDDSRIAQTLARAVGRMGHTVFHVSTGRAAAEWLAEHTADLMLLDDTLPDMRAEDVIALLRQQERLISFIVIAAADNLRDAVRMMRDGACDYVVKSADDLPAAVTAAVREALGNRSAGRTEQALRQSEERLRVVIEASGAGVWEWDLVAEVAYLSPRVCEMTGRSPSDPPPGAEETLALIHEDDRQRLIDEVRQHFEHREPLRIELRLVRKGEVIWVLLLAKALFDESGQPIRIVGSVVDISRNVRLQEQLSQSEQRYRLLVEHAPDAIVVHHEGRIIFANPAGVRLFGAREPQDLIGRKVLDMAHPDYRDIIERRRRSVIEQHRIAPPLLQKVLRLDGTWIEVEATVTPCLYDGKPAAQVMMRDVQERVTAERQAREHQANLAHVLRLHTMDNMVSELAHEINQPLHAITNYAAACKQVLTREKSASTSEVASWVGDIGRQAKRAGEIIHRLSRFVRRDAAERTNVQIDDLVQHIVSLVSIDARRHEVTLEMDLDPCPAIVTVARGQIEQVIVNLVVNAIEAMQEIPAEERKILITCKVTGDQVEIAVIDRGHAITDENFPRLFEAFFTTKPAGMGMGLNISRSIVEAHGGTLRAERNADRGMTFAFTLPVAGGSGSG